MDKISTKDRIEKALEMASDLIRQDPSSEMTPLVIDQLRFLKDTLERDGDLKAIPKGKMTIGLIAAREYDTSYPELADLLCKIDWAIDHGE